MIFEKLELEGAYVIRPEKREDDRGFFARGWCRRELEAEGLVSDLAQANISLSRARGTIRGMHYQLPPAAEVKLIRCTRGAVYDVIVDLRPDSPTYLRWCGVELAEDNYCMMYVPEGFAHGFQALTDNAEVFYLVSEFYTPGQERGLRFDDPAIRIEWPTPVTVISEKDRSWPDYVPAVASGSTPAGWAAAEERP